MKKFDSSYVFYGIAVLAVVGLIAFGAQEKANTPSELDGFAQCLTESGATMYGAWWCPHCDRQKDLFGSAIKGVNYVECSDAPSRSMNQTCKDAGVEGYPMWELGDGSRHGGEQPLEILAELTGCELPVESE